MDLKTFLTSKEKLPKGHKTDWLPYCKIEVKSGSLWAGDPHLPNADDGCVVTAPNGAYRVEAIGGKMGRYRVVSRLRVVLDSCSEASLGEEVGETGTDSAMIGVCDIVPFEESYRKGGADQVQEAIDSQMDDDFGILTVPGHPDLVMPFVPTGSDGTGPVYQLVYEGQVVGIELNFAPEE